MITAEQIRAARAMVRMDQSTLAKVSGVSVETIKRIERAVGDANATPKTLQALQDALEIAGVAFSEASEDTGPGVTLAVDYDKLRRERLTKVLASALSAQLLSGMSSDPGLIKRDSASIAKWLIARTDWREAFQQYMDDPVIQAFANPSADTGPVPKVISKALGDQLRRQGKRGTVIDKE
jgi:transcriptional regulator with XRE-family HTH domain